MLSGVLTPSSANTATRPKLLYEEESEHRNSSSSTTQTTITATTTLPLQISASLLNERTRTNAIGRSAALERAYVHDVYENCEETVGPIRPRVAQFLAGLDPGSVVCDVGSGNGRYLNSCNPLIYTIGVDRCYRLTKIARAKGGEVAVCDNLELPFRDESFDAVLSLAVVHHFATTERRVGAIRELARILRIGGRVVISVWALEQRHKRFESQDVLVPWQTPKNPNANTSDDEDDDDFLPPYHAYTEDSTNSSRSAGDGDSSSLSSSSPGESCYSFVRRAIQKLAGGKRHPWFLESWNSKDTKHENSLDYEDARDLPIELRRLEDFDDIPEPPLSAGLKSRSLGSILNPPPRTIVRSRSSVPSLGAQIPESKPSLNSTQESRRPKLVKQKQSFCDESDFSELPELQNVISNETTRGLLRKQSSLNEELMAESRLREKERVRKRIQKQMSLNEAFLCRSLFTKRLQVIREGFTTKLKTSTGSLERVTKNGIVKIMQNLKGTHPHQFNYNGSAAKPQEDVQSKSSLSPGIVSSTDTNVPDKLTVTNDNDDQKPRRHSRESGSDSSKDSSLQSDTSVESEDSFASVIYIPRPDQSTDSYNLSSAITNKIPSVPTSPLVMPCPTPAHSPAPSRCKLQANIKDGPRFTFEEAQIQRSDDKKKLIDPKITRQTIKNLPPIPKFRKNQPSFPIVRRTASTAPSVPKLMSLDIFNPETDDLDSDSSEPSSPDSDNSIDSVISALRPSTNKELSPLVESDVASPPKQLDDDINDDISLDDVFLVNEIKCDESKLDLLDIENSDENFVCKKNLVDFAEKLSAQLLKELDDDSDVIVKNNDSSSSCSTKNQKIDDPYVKKLNGDLKDLNQLREELRERRLMLANLNTSHNSINNNHNNSVIHEEDVSLIQEEDSADQSESENNNLINSSLNINCTNRNKLISSNNNLNNNQNHSLDSHQSQESWDHSNSTTSLDSPSVGGAATHHRYFHVFREGELDSLINHHVASLHIVSSYYERASWCVVAEKVQVWTI